MSKQSDAKEKQNYRDKPKWPECRNCIHFMSDEFKDQHTGWTSEANIRCNLGGFKVLKMATCDKHEPM